MMVHLGRAFGLALALSLLGCPLGVCQGFSALDARAEGPAVRPAQGNALGSGVDPKHPSAQRANGSMNGWPVGATIPVPAAQFPQGVALGWANRAPSGQAEAVEPEPGRIRGSPDARPHPNPLPKGEGTAAGPSSAADLAAYHARTRSAIKDVLSRREFADLHGDSFAAWRGLIRWIDSIFEAIVSPLRHLPGWVMWLIVAWLILALLAILAHLIYTLWRVLGGESFAADAGRPRHGRLGELLGIRELDFNAVYAEAGRLLKAGDWLAAVKYLYVAAILWLDRQGCIAFRSSKTNRDYLGELGGRERLQAPFRRLTEGFEAIVYGGQPATGVATEDMARTIEGLFHEPAGVIAS